MKPGIYDLEDNLLMKWDECLEYNSAYAAFVDSGIDKIPIKVVEPKLPMLIIFSFFDDCENIKEVVINKSVTYDNYSFKNCDLRKITIDEHLTDFLPSWLFINNPDAEIISNSESFICKNGCLYHEVIKNNETYYSLQFVTNHAPKDLFLDERAIRITSYSFQNNKSVESVNGINVKTIESDAFKDSNVRKINFPTIVLVFELAFEESKIENKEIHFKMPEVMFCKNSFANSNVRDIYIYNHPRVSLLTTWVADDLKELTFYVNNDDVKNKIAEWFPEATIKNITLESLLDSDKPITEINGILQNIEEER